MFKLIEQKGDTYIYQGYSYQITCTQYNGVWKHNFKIIGALPGGNLLVPDIIYGAGKYCYDFSIIKDLQPDYTSGDKLIANLQYVQTMLAAWEAFFSAQHSS